MSCTVCHRWRSQRRASLVICCSSLRLTHLWSCLHTTGAWGWGERGETSAAWTGSRVLVCSHHPVLGPVHLREFACFKYFTADFLIARTVSEDHHSRRNLPSCRAVLKHA